MRLPERPRLTENDIRSAVVGFRREHGIPDSCPVDVERIADVHLGLDIVTIPGLRRDRRVDGYVSADRTTIYVDEGLAEGDVLHRYRFTVAHEIGHWYLHSAVADAALEAGYPGMVDLINSISDDDHAWYEWQANRFAGLLLVPPSHLSKAVDEVVARAQRGGFTTFDLSVEAHRDRAAQFIAPRFDVSKDVVLFRGDADRHWTMRRAA